jgi:transcriptional regulator with XRE-family HTH domain
MGVPMAEVEPDAGRGIAAFSGTELRKLRIDRLLTQDELADRAGVSPGEVSHLECGRRRPTVLTLRALCSALGLDSPGALLSDDDPVPADLPAAVPAAHFSGGPAAAVS